MLTQPEQIEQFIETLFPTQDAKKLQAVQEAEGEVQDAASNDFWEALLLVGSVVFVLLMVSSLMVRDTPAQVPFGRVKLI